MADQHGDPEQRTQQEIREQAATEPPDEATSREGLEQVLADEGRSDEGLVIGEHVE